MYCTLQYRGSSHNAELLSRFSPRHTMTTPDPRGALGSWWRLSWVTGIEASDRQQMSV
jgi:hypothetical protein